MILDEDRNRALSIVLRAAEKTSSAVVVGNGDLSRRVGAHEIAVPALLLEGAMGMAAAVAFGLTVGGFQSVAVIEGDGNYILGAPAGRWFAGLQPSSAIHVVFMNGSYASSGGQTLPVDALSLLTADGFLAIPVSDLEMIQSRFDAWVAGRGLLRIALVEESSGPIEMPPRSAQALSDVAWRWRNGDGPGAQNLVEEDTELTHLWVGPENPS